MYAIVHESGDALTVVREMKSLVGAYVLAVLLTGRRAGVFHVVKV